MRLQFVSKLKPQQRDLTTRPYGRFFHVPRLLADAGHQVELILLGHSGVPAKSTSDRALTITALDARSLGPLETFRSLMERATSFDADWVVAFSDMHFGWLASRMASRSGSRLAVDAYDNYEAYMPWNLPLRYLWRRSIARADLVTAAGPQLARLLERSRAPGTRPVGVLPMCADPEFHPRERAACRDQLQLPLGVPLIGYFGSWAKRRGTDHLVRAFQELRASRPDVRLVMSGRPPAEALALPGALPVGYVPDAHLPLLLNAVDVACVISDDTAFGRYSYPSKLCEAMACGTPVVASGTDSIKWMLGNASATHTVPLGDSSALATKMGEMLDTREASYPALPDWNGVARQLEALLDRQ